MEDAPNGRAAPQDRLVAIEARNRAIQGDLDALDQVRRKVVAAVCRLHDSIASLEGLFLQAREAKNSPDEAAVHAILSEGQAAAEEARALLEAAP